MLILSLLFGLTEIVAVIAIIAVLLFALIYSLSLIAGIFSREIDLIVRGIFAGIPLLTGTLFIIKFLIEALA